MRQLADDALELAAVDAVRHLPEIADLRKLARNKNISGAVRMQVRRHLDRRKN